MCQYYSSYNSLIKISCLPVINPPIYTHLFTFINSYPTNFIALVDFRFTWIFPSSSSFNKCIYTLDVELRSVPVQISLTLGAYPFFLTKSTKKLYICSLLVPLVCLIPLSIVYHLSFIYLHISSNTCANFSRLLCTKYKSFPIFKGSFLSCAARTTFW